MPQEIAELEGIDLFSKSDFSGLKVPDFEELKGDDAKDKANQLLDGLNDFAKFIEKFDDSAKLFAEKLLDACNEAREHLGLPPAAELVESEIRNSVL